MMRQPWQHIPSIKRAARQALARRALARQALARRALALGTLLATLLPFSAQAAVTGKDIQVAARVLSFTATPFTGNVKLGIVYDPANAASAADEQSLLSILGSGLTVGNVNLLPVPVPIAKLGSIPADVLFLTAGLGAGAAQVGTQSVSGKLLCITTDPAATASGYCAVGVQSDPKVQITVNKAAAAASGVSFASAFLMMVTEI